MSKLKGTFIALAFAFANLSYGGVNVNNGNFYIAYTDFMQETSGINLDVTRTYNSRSSFAAGAFGVGWSSEYEGYLSFDNDNVIYHEAGGGNRIVFTPQKKGSTWLNSTYGQQTISKIKSGYLLVTDVARRLVFNPKGQLTKIADRNKNYIDLVYKENRLSMLKDNFNNQVAIEWKVFGGQPRVVSVQNGQIKATYAYSKEGNLQRATGADGIVYRYDYDNEHNMTKISYQDGTYKAMGYDKVKDWITSYRDQDTTFNNYEYIADKIDPENKFGTVVSRGREGQKSLEKAFFWYEFKRNSKGAKYNHRAVTLIGNLATETIFTECCGTPQTIAQWNVSEPGKIVAATLNWTKQGSDKLVTSFEYYDSGLLKKKIAANGVVTELSYDPKFQKIASVTKGGRTVSYKYDQRGNLAQAFDTLEKRLLDITYDVSGRITIVQETKRVAKNPSVRKVYFRYNASGQPVEIKEVRGNSSATVKLAYNDAGQVVELLNAKGRSIASDSEIATAQRIAGTFQSLLEIVQPSGVTLTPDYL